MGSGTGLGIMEYYISAELTKPIVSYCVSPVPCTCPVPMQCERVISPVKINRTSVKETLQPLIQVKTCASYCRVGSKV